MLYFPFVIASIMFGYFLHRHRHRTAVTSRCLLKSQHDPVSAHPLADLHLAVHPHKVARVVGLTPPPYPPATASPPAYIVPLQLPVVTPVLCHDPRLAAAGERLATTRNDESVVCVALFNSVQLSKVRRQTAERQAAMRDVLRKAPPHPGHERLTHELSWLFELFLQPLPVQPLVALLVQ